MQSVAAGHARAGNTNVNVNTERSGVVHAKMNAGILRPSKYSSKITRDISPDSVMYGVDGQTSELSRVSQRQAADTRVPASIKSILSSGLTNTPNLKRVSFHQLVDVHSVEKYIGVDDIDGFDDEAYQQNIDKLISKFRPVVVALAPSDHGEIRRQRPVSSQAAAADIPRLTRA